MMAGSFEDGKLEYKLGNFDEAFEVFKALSELRIAEARFALGLMYDKGQGVPKNSRKAVQWVRKAAEQGLVQAQKELGVRYSHGQGVPQDYAEAVKWYRKAAEQGYAAAQNSFGVMYLNGLGFPRDVNKALKWFQKATEQGDANAQNILLRLERKEKAEQGETGIKQGVLRIWVAGSLLWPIWVYFGKIRRIGNMRGDEIYIIPIVIAWIVLALGFWVAKGFGEAPKNNSPDTDRKN